MNEKNKKPKKTVQKKSSKSQEKKNSSKIDLEEIISDVVSETQIAVKNQPSKSSYLVNLRNTNEEFFSNEPIIPRPTGDFKEPPRPKPIVPKRKKNSLDGVDFIGRKNFFIFRFFKGIFRFLTYPFRIVFSETSYKEPIRKTMPKPQTEEKFGDDSEVFDIFAPQPAKSFVRFKVPTKAFKRLALFAVMLLIFILPLQAYTYYKDIKEAKDKILFATNEAIANLKLGEEAATELNLDDASSKFAIAQSNFVLAQNEITALNILNSDLLKLLPKQKSSVEAGVKLLEAGQIAAETGQILTGSGKRFLGDGDVSDYYHSLIQFEDDLRQAFDNFEIAKEKIQSISPDDLPLEHRATFSKVLKDIPKIEAGLKNLLKINTALLKILGHEQWQRYLIVFMNNNELRATGGFMGSFALIDVDRGEIKNLEIPGGGTYDIQGQLKYKVTSPEPLHLINSRWEFQDSNWWPDFPMSAQKMQWFHEGADGPSVDGVVALTATLMERLLDIFGPIEMPEYNTTITSANFRDEVQVYSALEYDKEENQPKKILRDIAPKLIERIFNAEKDQFEAMFDLLREGFNEKHLFVYFNNDKLEKLVEDFGWDGQLRSSDSDFLSIVHTNLAGGKTDGVIDEKIKHTAEVQKDGSIIDTIELTRIHNGVRGENIFTGVQNNSYVRFYVPQGSTLISAEGFNKPDQKYFDKILEDHEPDEDLLAYENNKTFDQKSGTDIYNEKNKTVFGNWLQLQPGEVQTTVIKYKLPFKISSEGGGKYYYSLLAQKQHGSLGSELTSMLKLNSNYALDSKFPEQTIIDNNSATFSSVLTTDQFYGVTLTKK